MTPGLRDVFAFSWRHWRRHPITLAILGVGKLLERERVRYVLGILSSLVLVVFGAMMIASIANTTTHDASDTMVTSNYLASFMSAFLLTISSPLTIVFWTR